LIGKKRTTDGEQRAAQNGELRVLRLALNSVGFCWLLKMTLRARCVILGSSSSIIRRISAPAHDLGQGDRRRAALEGVKKPPHQAVRGRVQLDWPPALAAVEQDSRRRSTSQVIQRCTASVAAVQ
jgi:hypothetical protein